VLKHKKARVLIPIVPLRTNWAAEMLPSWLARAVPMMSWMWGIAPTGMLKRQSCVMTELASLNPALTFSSLTMFSPNSCDERGRLVAVS
jgi:hypothetical protein